MAVLRFYEIVVLATALFLSVPAAASGSDPSPAEVAAETSPNETHTFRLRYQPEGFAFTWYLESIDQEVVFKKEPVFQGTEIVRGAMAVGPEQFAPFGFAWDKEGKALYLDTDRDFDLTDETPWGPPAKGGKQWAVFRGISLQVSVDGQPLECKIDVQLHNDMAYDDFATVRSGWVGSVALGGQDYDVAFMGRPGIGILDSGAYLFLAPGRVGFGAKDITFRHPASLWRVTPQMFLNDASYRLGAQFDGGDVLLSFTEIDRPLRTVSFGGKYVTRLEMYEYGEHSFCFRTVLDNPTGNLSVPTGEYFSAIVTLHDGSVPVSWKGFALGSIEIHDDGPIELRYGGPLKNTITAACSMSEITLRQSVRGVGGASYSPSDETEENAPTYAIRHAGKELVAGKFEYG